MKTSKLLLPAALSFLAASALACSGMEEKMTERLEELAAEGQVVMQEGTAFGAGTDQQGCLISSLDRAAACSGNAVETVSCQGWAQIYLQACLDHTAKSEGFCDGIPAQDAVMETVSYATAECEAIGRGEEHSCTNVMQGRAEWCQRGGGTSEL